MPDFIVVHCYLRRGSESDTFSTASGMFELIALGGSSFLGVRRLGGRTGSQNLRGEWVGVGGGGGSQVASAQVRLPAVASCPLQCSPRAVR